MMTKDLRNVLAGHWKQIVVSVAILVGAGAAVFAFTPGFGGEKSDRELIVARVNGTPISVKRFKESYVNFLITTGDNDTESNRFLHLNQLIDNYLMAEEARRRGMDEDSSFRAFYDRELRHTVGGQYYYEVFLDTLSPLTDAEIRQAFKRSKEKIVIRHLLFRDPEEARRAYERLQEGEDFIQLANEVYETEEYDSMAGFLGVASYWELDDAFAEAIWPQPVGVPTEPVRTTYGYHIILKEDHIYQPILTESEYEYRREGVSQKAHMRKLRLEGSDFIREYMTSLDVQVNEPAIYALREAIRRLSVETNERTYQPPPYLSSDEVNSLLDSFSPETPLLTYELDGETRVFTALDYYKWLVKLPYGEAKNRTAASVGRALRNEVLAIKGFEAGLDEHEVVTEYMQYASNVYLAASLRNHLRANEKAEPTEEEIEEGFYRLGHHKIEYAEADFWTIAFDSFRDASAAKKEIEEGRDPESFETYKYWENQDLRPLKSLGGHVRRALLDYTAVLGAGDGEWYVLHVDDRVVDWTTLDEKRDQIRETLATFMPEARLATDLRKEADVWVDSTLFREMMQTRQ